MLTVSHEFNSAHCSCQVSSNVFPVQSWLEIKMLCLVLAHYPPEVKTADDIHQRQMRNQCAGIVGGTKEELHEFGVVSPGKAGGLEI